MAEVAKDLRYQFLQDDVCDADAVCAAIRDFRPDVITHLAAEGHVDRPIDGPDAFIQTNMVGTYILLSEARAYWRELDQAGRSAFRFHHALAGESLPIFGRGANVRDWLYVEDHVRALQAVSERGAVGHTYNVGDNNEKRNLDVVETVCPSLDRLRPRVGGGSYKDQIAFVADRPGHDARYAIDASRIRNWLGWEPTKTFETGLEKTVRWYLDNEPWCAIVNERQADACRGLAA